VTLLEALANVAQESKREYLSSLGLRNTHMEQKLPASGPLEARYAAFLGTINQLRPRLHRYCSRMTGSVLDGEDVVQDALFEAYRKLDQI
jgi:hypothetical protein